MSNLLQALRMVAFGVDRQPSWLRSWPRWSRWLTIVVLVVVTFGLYGLATAVVISVHPTVGQWAPLIALVQVLPLALVVRQPLLAWRLGWLAMLLLPLMPERPWGNWQWDPVQIPVFGLAFIVAGLRYSRTVLWTMWTLSLGAFWLWGAPDPRDLIGGSIAFTVATLVVDSVAARLRAQRELRVEMGRTELEADRRAVLEERTRIARELHDVVAHHMSLIAVQAETAPYRQTGLAEPVRAEFAAISGAARDALTDMRRLLGVLRNEQTTMQRAPQPQLDEIAELVAATRRAGVHIELSVRGSPSPVPPTVGVCGYRIVQESLSNAGRHALGARVTVAVEYTADAVVLSVLTGRGGPPRTRRAPTPSSENRGHGLTGMRERVALLGGELSAGPTVEGGFAVRASLPLGRAA